MSRPKCGVAYEPICHSVEGCEKCDALMYFDGGGIKECIADTTDYFTPAEKVAALLDALEELTGIKGLGANNPMESRLAIAALSDYIRNSKPKEN